MNRASNNALWNKPVSIEKLNSQCLSAELEIERCSVCDKRSAGFESNESLFRNDGHDF